MLIKFGLLAAAFIVGFFVGRNNPNLAAVNTLIGAGKVAVNEAGKLIKKVK